jgi:hypothetical protein
VSTLQLLVSPYGPSEWESLDFDAMLNGCLLLKPRTGALTAFPDVFQTENVVEVSVDWKDLDKKVGRLLKVIPHVHTARHGFFSSTSALK